MQRLFADMFEPKINGPEMAVNLAALLNVNISSATLRKEIEEHPDNPSLLSISDVLNSYGIENLAIKTDANKLDQIPLPFITQILGLQSPTKYFTVVKAIPDGKVEFFEPEKHKWACIDKDDFASRFSGIVLMAEAAENAGEKDYIKKLKAEKSARFQRIILILCLPLLLVASGIIAFAEVGSSALMPLLFLIITLAGCALSSLLLWYEVDLHNNALQQICSSGKKINCAAVLRANAAKIAGISWSVIGFTYFMGMLLLLLFAGITNPACLFVLAWLTLATLPYIVFSIYYQARIAKQWCILCLGVQATLALQFVIVLTDSWLTIKPFNAFFSSMLFLQMFAAFAVPFIACTIAFSALKRANESKKNHIKLQKLKHSREIFEALLAKQKVLKESTEGLGILLGKPNATHKIIKVCNPYCGPCAKAHTPVDELLQSPIDLQIQILFTATNNAGDPKAMPVKHLLAIAETGEKITRKALDDWYLSDSKDYDAFALKYPMNGELKEQDDKVNAMREWCDKTEIAFTPTFFVNGHQLPEIYNISDLKYLLSA